jgi:DNA polymerase III subunit beta
MLIHASAKDLAKAAATAAEMALHKSPQQILNNLLLTVGDGVASFSGSNLDGHMTATTAVEQTEPGLLHRNRYRGSVLVDARIAKLLAGFPDGALAKITQADGVTTLACGRARYRIETLEADLFPTHPEAAETVEMALSDADRRRLFALPAPAVCDELTRYNLCGINLKTVSGRLIACATNGHSLIKASVASDCLLPADGVIVPGKACATIAKLDGCTLRIAANFIEARTESIRLTHNLIAGTFPSYERVIPEPAGKSVEVDRKELIAALGRMAQVGERVTTPSAILKWADDELLLSLGNHADVASDVLPAITSGKAQTAFSISLISRLLEAFSTERIVFDTRVYGEPVRITVPGDNDLVSVAMPMRVQGVELEAA